MVAVTDNVRLGRIETPIWSNLENYVIGDTVIDGLNIYRAIAPSLNVDPSIDVAGAGLFWEVFGTSYETGTGQVGMATVDGNTATGIVTNNDDAINAARVISGGINVTTGSITARDVTFVAEAFPTAISSTLGTVWDCEGCTFIINEGNLDGVGGQRTYVMNGRWNLTDHKIVMPSISGERLIGDFSNNTNWQPFINGLQIVVPETDNNAAIFHTGSMSLTNNRLDGIELLGRVTAQLKAVGSSFNYNPGNFGSAQSSIETTTYNYNTRFVHQGQPATNVSNTAAATTTPTQYALYTNYQFGPYADTTGRPENSLVNRIITLQFNRRAALWLVNPDFGTSGDDVHVSFHSGNYPGSTGGGRTASQEAAECRLYFAHRPVFRDAASLNVISEPIKITYNQDTRELNTYVFNDVPQPPANGRNEFEITDNSTQLITLQEYNHYGSANLEPLANRNPGMHTITNNANVTVPFRVRSYTYNMLLDGTVGRTTSVATASDTYTENFIDGQSLAQYLNGRAVDFDFSTLTGNDAADWYPALRQVWYNNDNPYGTIAALPVLANGTFFQFFRDLTFTTTGTTTVPATGPLVLAVNAGTTTLTGENTTFDFGAHNVTWAGTNIPDGATIDGGIHLGLGNMAGISWTATGTPNVEVTGGGQTSAAAIVGNPTGNVRILSDTPITISNDGLDITAGTNVTIASNLNITGGTGNANSRVTVWALTSDTASAPVDGAPFRTFTGSDAQTINLSTSDTDPIVVGTSYRIVYCEPGRNHNVAHAEISAASTLNITLDTTETPSASIQTLATAVVDVVWTGSRGNFRISGARGSAFNTGGVTETRLSETQTNALFESAKATAGFSETVARLNQANNAQIVAHPADTTTTLREGTYILNTANPGSQQLLTSLQEQPADGGNPALIANIGTLTGQLGTFSALTNELGIGSIAVVGGDAHIEITFPLTVSANTVQGMFPNGRQFRVTGPNQAMFPALFTTNGFTNVSDGTNTIVDVHVVESITGIGFPVAPNTAYNIDLYTEGDTLLQIPSVSVADRSSGIGYGDAVGLFQNTQEAIEDALLDGTASVRVNSYTTDGDTALISAIQRSGAV